MLQMNFCQIIAKSAASICFCGKVGLLFSFFLKKEGRRQPVCWNRLPAPTSTVYQKEKEKTRKE